MFPIVTLGEHIVVSFRQQVQLRTISVRMEWSWLMDCSATSTPAHQSDGFISMAAPTGVRSAIHRPDKNTERSLNTEMKKLILSWNWIYSSFRCTRTQNTLKTSTIIKKSGLGFSARKTRSLHSIYVCATLDWKVTAGFL